MAKANRERETSEPVVIKKYANRRLYNTATSTYVTLEDLAEMVKSGTDFVVFDAKTGEDITRSVLTQIIFELESKGPNNLLPITFLRQMIRFYGDSMQNLVPTYLDFSIESLVKEQEKFRNQMTQAFGGGALDVMRENVKRNTEMFEKAMRMFVPFGPGGGTGESGGNAPEKGEAQSGDDIESLKQQINEMRDKLDKMSGSS